MKKAIEWSSKQVLLEHIKPTPVNYKIRSDIGRERFQESLKMFGLAGNVIVNPDGNKFMLIDGNSRLEEAKAKKMKKVWVSVPNRKLTPIEFKQMSAMFDFATASEVDIERIQKDLGTSDDFFNTWKLTVPMEILDKIGKTGKVVAPLHPEHKTTNGTDARGVSNVVMVQLFFSSKQEAVFRKMEEKLAKKFKTNSTTDTVLKTMVYACK